MIGQERAGNGTVDQERELTADDVAREFPGWHIWKGMCGLWYARLANSSPPVIVRGEDPTDLRDEIRRKLLTGR
jgi:hypothetical protein